MEKITIEAESREKKNTAKKMKKDGTIPAVVYGKETKTMPIEIKIKDIEKTVKTLAKGNILITLKLTDRDKKEEKTVTIREIRRDPATEEILHADFHQLVEGEKTRFEVPIVGSGVPEGVKMGGVLEAFARKMKIKCEPGRLPEKFEVDLSGLNVGDEIKVKDFPVPEGVEIMDNPDNKLFAVVGARKVVEAGEETPAAAEPEVVGEEKKEDKK
ncbi:MAG: 50S ribosomal protein L25 [Candidatus Goldiibacteriota bacterium]